MHGLVLGAASKVVASTATYPYQVVKARVQQRGAPCDIVALGTARATCGSTRAPAVLPGLLRERARVVPAAAVTFSTREYTAGLLLRSRASEGRAE